MWIIKLLGQEDWTEVSGEFIRAALRDEYGELKGDPDWVEQDVEWDMGWIESGECGQFADGTKIAYRKDA